MKISIAISILILAIAGMLRWQGGQRLSQAENTHAKLSSEAASLGISIDSKNPDAEALVTKRAREDKAAEARDVAKKMVAFALEMEAMQQSGEDGGEEMQERVGEFMDLMLSLDAGQLKILIAEFRANTEVKKEMRTNMIAFAIMTLANDHPQAALSIFTESEDLLGNEGMGKHVLSTSLANWASTDPEGALDWVRENGKKHPDLITDDVKAGLIKGAATKDMQLGFDLLKELGMKDTGKAISGLAGGVKTPEERTTFLNLLREYKEANTNNSKKNDEIASGRLIGDGIAKDGFAKGSKWIIENDLSSKEIDDIATTLVYSTKSGETGQWIAWMGENVSEKNKANRIGDAMRNWTNSDYRAAGEWLAAAPTGETKNASVKTYAETVARYDPQTAAQWALTLPEGKAKTETIRNIHNNWPKDTPEQEAARAAYKQEQGIK